MKLVEALKILQQPLPEAAEPFQAFLACGCEPLHLKTFFAAHLQRRLPRHRLTVETGLYGDCLGNLHRIISPKSKIQNPKSDGIVLVMEWADIDPRLGLRSLGGWGPSDLADILKTVNARLPRYLEAIECAAKAAPLVLCLPTLPLPPVAFTSPQQAGEFDLALQESLSAFAAQVARQTGARIAHPQRLARRSPLDGRLDVKSELAFGFPYTLAHADALGETLAALMRPDAPKKGLITDLDDTLWRGLVGEIGAQNIAWDLENHSQIHGLYQQFLHALAEAGILIAVASKNDPARVEEAFQREDLILSKAHVFPIEAHWEPKSVSVRRILQAWNVGADSVVFVDDSPLELAEVKAAHPDVECLLFPASEAEAYQLLERLRDLFGKERLTEEDSLRLDSLRQAQTFRAEAAQEGAQTDEFLREVGAEITVSFAKAPPDARAFELVNKTNQFNLNGKRYTENEWASYLAESDTFLLTVSYKDKYGALGKIAVLAGRREPAPTQGEHKVRPNAQHRLCIDTWVMSCRAFARRIEHQCLALLFRRFDVEEIAFAFQETPRNGPLQEFFQNLTGRAPKPEFRIAKTLFDENCPPLFHAVREE